MKFDFSGEENRDFPDIEDGEHVVEVESVTEETSKAGNPMILFKLRAKNNCLIFHRCINLPKKRWMLKKTIEAILGKEQPSKEVYINLDDLVGEEVKVVIKHDDYGPKVSDILLYDQFNSGEIIGRKGDIAPF